MTHNNDKMDLKKLIAEGEHQGQDFKYTISSVNKIAHSLSAFANTKGGRLLVGVRDDGRIAGVRSEEEIYMIDAAAQCFCKPAVDCQMKTIRMQGHTVLICTIEPSNYCPVCAKEEDGSLRAYVRVADENIVASPVHLELWRAEQRTLESFVSEDDCKWLALFTENGPMTLNRFCRKIRKPRHYAIKLLALFLRFGLLRIFLHEHQWYFDLENKD